MIEKKVSIVVPVYKVENYLKECIESLIHQTYGNLEIILIDDESPDNCPQICDEYALLDQRIQVIHKKNGGAASARNMGLDVVSGEYIAFVDSDDYVELNFIECLVKKIERHKADVSVCSFSDIYINYKQMIKFEETGIFTKVEFLERFLEDWRCGLIWNKLFKAKLLRDIRFTEGHVIDDEFFTYKVILAAEKVVIINEMLYNYRQRKSSVMSQGRRKQMLLDRMTYFPERFELVTKNIPQLYPMYLSNFVDNMIIFKRETGEFPDVWEKASQMQKKYFMQVMISPVDWKLKYAFLRSLLSGRKNSIRKENTMEKENFFD